MTKRVISRWYKENKWTMVVLILIIIIAGTYPLGKAITPIFEFLNNKNIINATSVTTIEKGIFAWLLLAFLATLILIVSIWIVRFIRYEKASIRYAKLTITDLRNLADESETASLYISKIRDIIFYGADNWNHFCMNREELNTIIDCAIRKWGVDECNKIHLMSWHIKNFGFISHLDDMKIIDVKTASPYGPCLVLAKQTPQREWISPIIWTENKALMIDIDSHKVDPIRKEIKNTSDTTQLIQYFYKSDATYDVG